MLAVLNFDSVGVPLVERLLAEGRLPVLESLRARGQHRQLDSPLLYFADEDAASAPTVKAKHAAGNRTTGSTSPSSGRRRSSG